MKEEKMIMEIDMEDMMITIINIAYGFYEKHPDWSGCFCFYLFRWEIVVEDSLIDDLFFLWGLVFETSLG